MIMRGTLEDGFRIRENFKEPIDERRGFEN